MSKTDQRSPISLPTTLLEASIGCGVTVDSNGNAVLPSAGGSIIGVLYGLSGTGTAAVVRTPCDGAVMLQYGGTVTLPATLKVNASGQFVSASAGDIAAGSGVAQALDGGSSGELHAGILFGGAGAQTAIGGDETVTSGALSASVDVSYLSVTGTQAYTLPNPTFAGQKRSIECSVAATSPAGTLTITTPFTGEQATYFFDTVLQRIDFVAKTISAGVFGWHLTAKRRVGNTLAALVVGTATIALSDLHEFQNLSVTGTVASALAAGNMPGERMYFYVSAAASTPSGTITGTFQTKVGGTSVAWGHTTPINATTAYVGVEWNGAAWCEVLPSTTAAF